ncbi:DNA/RNA helicase domain-containing protein [Companilactobacillus baiquanensis]|uniref:DNA/RNA helicase domain-containing protein n=1 Tax=Companilactobacillus baiquanensis TaxID=2486005 RepID=A0ABW1UZW3_9LACO|nr:DNA/RNA helicase domain-containing protein [Companilactobacillus baiquanensis]
MDIVNKEPIIKKVKYSKNGLDELKRQLERNNKRDEILLEKYPTVYIIYHKDKKGKFITYVGETDDINRRTVEHLKNSKDDWKFLSKNKDSQMLVIGHPFFNKSLTLDIENQFIMSLNAMESVKYNLNQRSNAQNEYFTSFYMMKLFIDIWDNLHNKYEKLFPLDAASTIDTALYKISPFHRLTDEQSKAVLDISEKIFEASVNQELGQIIFVEGAAGTGKTVMLSNLFHSIISGKGIHDGKDYLLVNHDEQLKVYRQLAMKLKWVKNPNNDMISKPTHFILEHEKHPDKKADTILVDEAHLMWTQGKQSYRGKNQLDDLRKFAKTIVVIFDRKQILKTEEYWENKKILDLEEQAKKEGRFIELTHQLRMKAGTNTTNWLNDFIYNGKIDILPRDLNYEVKVMKSPKELHEKIINKNRNKKYGHGLSRVLSTFDWKYKQKGIPDDNGEKYWNVIIDKWKLPWNLQLPVKDKKIKKLPWAEQPQTINEVGSTYTIQGFDLNYAGVIIGPSVKFRDGKVIFCPEDSENSNAIRNRTLENGKKINVAQELLRNELNVLLTRGVNGLYLYAVDEALQCELIKNIKK